MIVTSKTNEKIKYINSLKDKKYRDKYNKYILEGIKLVDEYISSGENIPEFIVMSEAMLKKNTGGEELFDKVKNLQYTIQVDEKIFKYLCDTETPQGILAVLNKPLKKYIDLVKNISGKYVILDKVADAGNLGTIIRTCVSFGVNNLICIKGTVDAYSPKTVRSTMGAISKLNIYYIDEEDIKELIYMLNANNYELVSTELTATNYLHETHPTDKTIYVLGNEANGVDDKIRALCNRHVKIPMEDIQESLNVSVASSILIYDAYIRNKNNNE